MVHHKWLKPEAERIPDVLEDGRERAETCLAALESNLQDKRYLIGEELTVADIMMGYSLLLARRLEVLDERYPAVCRYYARLEERPGFAKATR